MTNRVGDNGGPSNVSFFSNLQPKPNENRLDRKDNKNQTATSSSHDNKNNNVVSIFSHASNNMSNIFPNKTKESGAAREAGLNEEEKEYLKNNKEDILRSFSNVEDLIKNKRDNSDYEKDALNMLKRGYSPKEAVSASFRKMINSAVNETENTYGSNSREAVICKECGKLLLGKLKNCDENSSLEEIVAASKKDLTNPEIDKACRRSIRKFIKMDQEG